jgi:hypothetical protein
MPHPLYWLEKCKDPPGQGKELRQIQFFKEVYAAFFLFPLAPRPAKVPYQIVPVAIERWLFLGSAASAMLCAMMTEMGAKG